MARTFIRTGDLADSIITSAKLASSSVITAALADLNVTEGKLADGAVATAKIAGVAVTTAKLADAAVTTLKVADANITAAKLAADAVETAKIKDAQVTLAKMASNSVDASKIVDGAVGTAELADDAVTAAKILAGAVGTAELADASVTAAKADRTGAWDFTGATVSVAAPSSGSHATTKTYVDTAVSTLSSGATWKASARVAAVANVDLSTGLASGTTINGITLATGDRVLVWKQTDEKQNGVYIAPASGAASRSTDFDSPNEMQGAAILVREGTAYADQGFIQITSDVVVGTSNIVFTQFTALGQVVAGLGLVKSSDNTTMDVNVGDGIEIVSDKVTAKVEANKGLSVGGAGLAVVLGANKGLEFLSGALAIKSANGVQVDGSGFVSIKLNASNPGLVADASGLSAKLDSADGSLDVGADGLKVKALGISTAKLADAAVSTAKIADAAVVTAKIGDGQVTYAKLASDVKLAIGKFDRCDTFIATAGQTDFDLSQSDAASGMGGHLVFVNGRLMLIGVGNDYTFGDGTGTAGKDKITMEYGLVSGDVVAVAYGRDA